MRNAVQRRVGGSTGIDTAMERCSATLARQTSYTTRCLLSVRHICSSSSERDDSVWITAISWGKTSFVICCRMFAAG